MVLLELTRYERARILGARALQISMGAPPLLPADAPDAILLAAAEQDAGILPITTRRVPLAND